jgi:DNA-nicking Smr family endonuclease
MSRRLRPDELELWQVVARTADRLPSKLAAPQTIENTPASVSPKPKKSAKKMDPLPSFSIGSKAAAPGATRDTLPTFADRLRAAPVQMDSKSYRSMQRGKLKPEGRIDLHGMTLSQAHPALI